MTFDGKCEKFELFEDLFYTMIKKIQPEMSEQMKVNHFHSLPKHQHKQQINSRKRISHLQTEIR